jgi:hypothetical protein
VPEYIANSGSSCFYCKSQLYTTLQGVADEFIEAAGPSDSKVVMYNGTNADDRRDPTRLGLVAAVGDCIPTTGWNDSFFACSRPHILSSSCAVHHHLLTLVHSIGLHAILLSSSTLCLGQLQRRQPVGRADKGRGERSEP